MVVPMAVQQLKLQLHSVRMAPVLYWKQSDGFCTAPVSNCECTQGRGESSLGKPPEKAETTSACASVFLFFFFQLFDSRVSHRFYQLRLCSDVCASWFPCSGVSHSVQSTILRGIESSLTSLHNAKTVEKRRVEFSSISGGRSARSAARPSAPTLIDDGRSHQNEAFSD